MTAIRRNDYADRARAFQLGATKAHQVGDLERATDLEELATRCEMAHVTQPWRTADDLRYDGEDCCIGCQQHMSDPHQVDCIYGDGSHVTA